MTPRSGTTRVRSPELHGDTIFWSLPVAHAIVRVPPAGPDGGAVIEVAAQPVANVVDTTAAGDAFNGGYLAARIAGLPIDAAVGHGHAVAGAVVQHRGAIIPADAMPAPV